MGNIFRKLTSHHHNLLSPHVIDQIHSRQLVRKFSRSNRINSILLTTSIIMIGSLAIIMAGSKNTETQPVLGTTNSIDLQEYQLSSPALTAREYCRQNGGQVNSRSLESGLEENTCIFLDGTECDVSIYFQTGTCSIPNQTPTERSVYIPEKIAPRNIDRQSYIYYVSINNKSDDVEPIDSILSNYLYTVLQLNESTLINSIYFDTRQGDPFNKEQGGKYNFSYYIVTNGQISTSDKEDYASSISISPVESDLLKYFTDTQYCISTNDCIIRDNFCSNGAFNHFHQFQDGWICRGKTDQYGDSIIIYDQNKQCKAQKFFSLPECIQNLCTPTLFTTQCIN